MGNKYDEWWVASGESMCNVERNMTSRKTKENIICESCRNKVVTKYGNNILKVSMV